MRLPGADDQPRDPAGRRQRQFLRDHAPERQAENRRGGHVERVEQSERVARIIGHASPGRSRIGVAMPGQVDGDNGMP